MLRLPLYLGLDPKDLPCVHYPVIRTQMRSLEDPQLMEAFGEIGAYTHLLFTSQQTVRFFFKCVKNRERLLLGKEWVSIGEATSRRLREEGVPSLYTAATATQEGLIALLDQMTLPEQVYFFYPRSNLARPLLAEYLQQKRWRVRLLDLYETTFQKLEPVPDLTQFEEIIFTSPSTVEGFLRIYGQLPVGKSLKAIGPVTAAAVEKAWAFER